MLIACLGDQYITILPYNHARYYNPVLARFVSADTIVPDSGALTVWPSDGTAAPLFKQGGKDKDKDGKPTAPEDPQTLNRYSYVENNPLSNNDPNGHCSGGSLANNFVSIFNGTCFQKGMFIMAHARTPGEWALGAFAAVGPSAAVALLTAGTFGLGYAAIEASGLTTAGTVGAATGRMLLDGVNKAEARDALRADIDGLSAGQTQKALDALGRGRVDNFSIRLLENGNVEMIADRAGQDGFQRLTYTLDSSGKTIKLLQEAFNAAGEIVHIHDKVNDNIIK